MNKVMFTIMILLILGALGTSVYLFFMNPRQLTQTISTTTTLTSLPPELPPSNTPTTTGTIKLEVPVYPGANEFLIPDWMKLRLGIPSDASPEGYTTSADAEEVVDWYLQHMGEWELVKENSFFPDTKTAVYLQYYRSGDSGVFIFAVMTTEMEGTIFGIVTGSWAAVLGYGPAAEEQAEEEKVFGFDPALPPGELEFTFSPVEIDLIKYIIPLGNLVPPAHTLPTDHIYFVYGGAKSDVFAPTSGKVLEIRPSGPDDNQIIIGVSSSFSYYLDHVIVDEKIKVGDYVDAGQRLGNLAPPTALDLGVLNKDLINPFVNPQRYSSKGIHGDKPLQYFVEPIKTQLYSMVATTGEDKNGTFCSDVPGKLIGNWFYENIPPEVLNTSEFEEYAIAFVYSNYDPSQVMISIGSEMVGLPPAAYKAEGPPPESVAPSSGKVAYKLYSFQCGWPFNYGGRVGILIVEMLDENTLRVEAFSDVVSETREFTSNAKIYLR
ncbi:MAG: hypothetical protein QW835_02170 [Candidatus Hadarchaeum sp.]|uniref:hypothetical protein n=1 Tax=Candidatus Hadarchaeum sp. TaxID=2883567 RepID=UPI003182AEBF